MSLPGSIDLIENYVYLYHTKTFIIIPQYPESISDSMTANFASTPILSRSAPIFSYSNSGPRSVQVSLSLHRDMMNTFNTDKSNVTLDIGDDYVDTLIKQIQAIALPQYNSSERMVNPPLIAVRFGSDIFIKGIVQGSVTVTYKTPIIQDKITGLDKYALVDIAFNVSEVDPYDADTVMQNGSFRGLNTTLESKLFRVPRGTSTTIR